MPEREYQICTRCIMDTTDPDITFDEQGVCNHCHNYDKMIKQQIFSGEDGRIALDKIVEECKKAGRGKEYDCIIGVSGGVDSTYLAFLIKKLGLRVLAVHLDNGWNSELAVANIENVLNKVGIPLHTEVLQWEEFKDIQLSFLKSSTPDSEIPTDHAILTVLYRMAIEIGTPYVIIGFNARTESHLPRAWSQGHWDWRYIKSIQRQFGTLPLKTYPHLTFMDCHKRQTRQKWVSLLNYIDYVKKDAMLVLEKELGWRYYGGKHYESIYTRFYQGYILPKKFGFDKRRTHFSSLICSGEISRQEVLHALEQEAYPREMQMGDKEYVIKKLGLTEEGFEAIMALPHKTYHDYPNHEAIRNSLLFRGIAAIARMIRAGNT